MYSSEMSEVSQRKTNTIWVHSYVESKTKMQKENDQTKQKLTHRYREKINDYQKGGGWGLCKMDEEGQLYVDEC